VKTSLPRIDADSHGSGRHIVARVSGSEKIHEELYAYVAKSIWNLDASSLPYLGMAARRGLGTIEFEKLRTRIKTI
jgi:CRISPR/Cas system CSM-associated protein Csm3 (group 7 of RAMP superfamily)